VAGARPRRHGGAADWAWSFGYDLAVQRRRPLVDRVRREVLPTRADPEAARAADRFTTIADDIVVVVRTPDLLRLRGRTLVLTGAHDRLVDPEHARRRHAGIPSSTLLVYDQLGHLPGLEDGARLPADVVEFLRAPGGWLPPRARRLLHVTQRRRARGSVAGAG